MPSSGNKNSGEIAQSVFYSEVLKHGFVPLISCGDNLPFDLVVYNQTTHRFFKVQIKSTIGPSGPRTKWTVGCGRKVKRSYLTSEVDLVALHNFSNGDWYVIPTGELNGATSVTVSSRQQRWEPFKNCWSPFNLCP